MGADNGLFSYLGSALLTKFGFGCSRSGSVHFVFLLFCDAVVIFKSHTLTIDRRALRGDIITYMGNIVNPYG